MNTKRVVLYVAAALLVIPTFLVATTDVHTGSNDCGSALVTRDPTRDGVQDEANPTAADYTAQTVRDTCSYLVTRQRVGAAVPLVLLAVCLFFANRRPRRQRLPGGPVI